MTRGDIIGLVLSYVYAFGMLLVVEAVGKRLKWSAHFTRKIIHIGAGLWIWGVLALFDHWYFGVIPFATFIVLNTIFYRQQTFKQMDASDATPGTIYFALSITILFVLLWRTEGGIDRVPLAAAAVMAMTLGDAMASIMGRRWGRHHYTVFGATRSWEGTVAMFIFSAAGIFITLLLLSGSSLSPNSEMLPIGQVVLMALFGAVIASAAEAVSPAGTDNLSVPLLTALALYGLSLLL